MNDDWLWPNIRWTDWREATNHPDIRYSRAFTYIMFDGEPRYYAHALIAKTDTTLEDIEKRRAKVVEELKAAVEKGELPNPNVRPFKAEDNLPLVIE